MSPRVVIDPAECRRVANVLDSTADAHLVDARGLSAADLPSMPPDIRVFVSEGICNINIGLGRLAADLEEQARVLEVAARIIELDQDVRGANWGLGAISAALGAVLRRPGVQSLHALTDDVLGILLASGDMSDLSVQDWRHIALWKAGIAPEEWDVSRGLAELDDIVRKVYAYYGQLYLDDPRFKWAGMARLVGPMFYAGWQDMHVIRNVIDPEKRAEYLRELFGISGVPSFLWPSHIQDALDGVTALSAEELGQFEQRFLAMQKEIFQDLAWQHEAFKHGGLDAIRGLVNTDELDRQALRAWEDIASGLPDRVAAGNRDLLFREQWTVIQDDYDRMRNHRPPIGWSFTYVMTALAENPFPEGKPYRDFDGITIDPDPDVEIGPLSVPIVLPHIPRPDLEIQLPLGNISYFGDRWRWIDEDMLPAYQRFEQNASEMNQAINRDFGDQARLFRRINVNTRSD